MLLLVLDGFLQVADRLRARNLDKEDSAWIIAKNPTVELEYSGHDECRSWLSCEK